MPELKRLKKNVDAYAEAAESTHADFYAAIARKKLEHLEKNVVDTAADYAAIVADADVLNAAVPYDADYDSTAAYVADLAADDAGRAYDEWVKARLDLNNYLKEQQANG
tara:strand:+ start:510 stop:836 length:327 start_codon:yes stop_codon:yes gene_type:complete